MVRTLCVDFDGVLHSYTSGWQGPDVISDPPVPGALEWLEKAVERYTVCIYSSRSKEPGGIGAMQEWLVRHGISQPALKALKFSVAKPAAYLALDDRAICFTGTFPTFLEIDNFKPWNKRYIYWANSFRRVRAVGKFDTEPDLLPVILGVLLFIFGLGWVVQSCVVARKECTEKGGILLRGEIGHVCVDKKVVK